MRSRIWLAAAIVAVTAIAVFAIENSDDTSSGAPTSRSTQAWGSLAPSPLQRSEVGGARIGTSIYVVGGYTAADPGASTNEVARYDIKGNSWTLAPPMPIALNHPAVTSFK